MSPARRAGPPAPSSALVLRPGHIVGQRYEILDRIAAGGMGAVYRAQHVLSRRTVALKLIHSHVAMEPAAVARFRNEAAAGSLIGHEGIVQVLDAGVDAEDGTLFLAMELLVGEDLRKRLSRADTTRRGAVDLVLDLLEPLAAAHAKGYVHRDLKPENIFVVRPTAERPRQVKLLDFGIAKNLGAGASLTQTGAALGTPHYMAPEQVMSSKGASPAADVWAVGVILWEILTGAPPFSGETPHAVVVNACTKAPPPLADLASDVGPALASLLHRCLSKDAAGRPADANALREELVAALQRDPDLATRPVTIAPPSSDDFAPTELSTEPDTLRGSSPTPLTAPRSMWRREAGAGFSLEVPPSWRRVESLVPHVVVQLEAPEEVEGLVPSVRLKLEAWPGTTREYVDLGLDNLAHVATIHRTSDAGFGGLPGVEVEATYHTADPPFRALTRCVAVDGQGRVAVAKGPVLGFGQVAPILRAILGSFRWEPPSGA